MMTAVSLFAGVGGFDIALERTGIDIVAAVEIDDAARGVLAHQFPNTRLFTDVCEVTGEQLLAAGFVPDRGIITGGFPCQDLSVAGKRAGLDGKRSGLFWEICRLLDECRPRWIVLENVPGLLSSNGGRDMGAVIGALVDRGYGIAYRVLDAQFFGVPQRRRRVVIVGCLGDDGRTPAQILAVGEGVRGDSQASEPERQEVAGTIGGGAGSRGDAEDFETWQEADVTNTLNTFDNGDIRAADVVVAFGHKQGLDVQASEEATPTLRANGDGAGILASTVRRLTPMECERLQGFPDGWTARRIDFKTGTVIPQADSARYKQMGNAVAVPVFVWVLERLMAAESVSERAA